MMRIEFLKHNETPGILITPELSKGSVLVAHGYGGCKEEIIGLSLKIAVLGFTVYTIDIQGHGENTSPLSFGVVHEISDCVEFCRQFGKVTVIGHSLGGRLALTSAADFAVGISPALADEYDQKTHSVLKSKRQFRVREINPDILFELVRDLPVFHPNSKSFILFAAKDIPEIFDECKKLQSDIRAVEIQNASHSDIYLLEKTFSLVSGQMLDWYS